MNEERYLLQTIKYYQTKLNKQFEDVYVMNPHHKIYENWIISKTKKIPRIFMEIVELERKLF